MSRMIAFGPVPSRRLGHSLGINNIPPKICTYSCVYCQLGRTKKMQVERRMFYNPQKILRDVQDKVKKVKETGDPIDYLTFVPDGEPTLDINLAYEIDLLKSLGIKIAVISNGSLIWREDVRESLMKADWVSLKIDSVQEEFWRKINRPYGTLQLSSIQQGMFEFARAYRGELVTETMLVRTVNDSEDGLSKIADLLARLRPDRAYLSIPTRPPAEEWAQPPPEEIINQAYHILHERIDQVEYLIGYEGNDFAFTGNVEEDLLSITAVHPMREEAVSDLLARAGADWSVIHRLIDRGQLIETKYKGRKFYMRRLSARYTG
ncbi:MAG: radical SAM protein [Methanosarcinaceae archaeon]|nr:radical SAM protein [Methanosarcinaceae archaeon]